MPKYAYCVSCNANSEAALERDLRRQLPDAEVYFPVFDRQEKKDGRWTTRTHPLLPGYLFIYSDALLEPMEIIRAERVTRLLGYADKVELDGGVVEQKSYLLSGADLEFANWVYAHGGHIGVSTAAQVGATVRIVDGPLKYYEGVIKKLDKHKRSALVSITVGSSVKDIWLSFQWVEAEGTITQEHA